MKRFSVVGAGNLGTHMIHALVQQGYQLTGILEKSKFDLYQSLVTNSPGRMVKQSDFIIIAVQESRMPEAVECLANLSDPAGKIIFHTANSLSSDMLAELKEKGAFTASFSPLQTFPEFSLNKEDVFKGCYFLLEGDAPAVALAQEIAGRLKAAALPVAKEQKIYFHIAGVAASNFLISILKLAQRQLDKAKQNAPQTTEPTTDNVSTEGQQDPYHIGVLLPLIRQTISNVENRGLSQSLTGPFKRNEMGVIKKHMEMLDKDDETLYKALTHFLGL